MRRVRASSARGAGVVLAAVVVATAVVVVQRQSAAVPGPSTSWRPAAVAPGTAELVAGTGVGRNCFASTTSVAARGKSVFAAAICEPGAGDESAPVATPAYAVDALTGDGAIARLGTLVDKRARLTVESVGPDGTLWALQGGSVLTRSPGGRFTTLDLGPGVNESDSFTGDDVVDLDVGGDGTVLFARLHEVSVRPAVGPLWVIAGGPGGSVGQTDYADQAVPNARPALGAPLPTVTGVTTRSDGTVVILTTDSVLTVDGRGVLRTLVSPASSTDPAVRLVRAAVRDGGSGSYLSDAAPYGDDILMYDQAGARVLRVDVDGNTTLVAGTPVNRIGTPGRGVGPDRVEQWGADGKAVLPLDEVRLGYGGSLGRSVRLAVLGDGQVLTSSTEGVIRLGLAP